MKAAGYCLNFSGDGFKLLKEQIIKVAESIREIIANEAQKKCVSLMMDIGTKNEKSFLGIDVQLVVDKKLVSRSIGMFYFEDGRKSEDILNLVEKCLQRFGVKIEQVLSVTTDNGPNVKKAAREINAMPSSHHHVNEQLNSTVENSDDEVIDELFACDDFSSLMSQFVAKFHDKADDDWFLYISGINCCVHTIQLVMNDAFKMLPSTDANIINQCREVAKFLRLESTRNELRKNNIEIKKIRLDVNTRWCSKLNMV